MGSVFKVYASLFVGLFLLGAVAQTQVQGNWQKEVVDTVLPGEADSFSSLAIDRFGNFHLAYSNRNGTVLKYAYRAKQEKRWDKATVDPDGGTFDALTVDSHGFAHIAYNSPRLNGLHYAFWDGTQWQKVLVDTDRTSGQTAIVLDSQDHPRISYYREQYPDRRFARYLKYAYFDGKSWYIQTVDHRSGSGHWNSIVLDHAERPCISYSITTTGNLGFACLHESAWEHASADSRSEKGKRFVDYVNSIAMDAAGEPRAAFFSASDRTVNYAWKQGEVWHQETVDSLVSTGAESERIFLKVDKSGRPHIVYYDSGLGALKYATRDDKGWHRETIDSDNAGDYASFCLDGSDQPYVSYYASADKELRIAHRGPVDLGQKP
jgi:hypothetical protein